MHEVRIQVHSTPVLLDEYGHRNLHLLQTVVHTNRGQKQSSLRRFEWSRNDELLFHVAVYVMHRILRLRQRRSGGRELVRDEAENVLCLYGAISSQMDGRDASRMCTRIQSISCLSKREIK